MRLDPSTAEIAMQTVCDTLLGIEPGVRETFPSASAAIPPKTDAFACNATARGGGTLPLLALPLSFCQKLMPLLVVLQADWLLATPIGRATSQRSS